MDLFARLGCAWMADFLGWRFCRGLESDWETLVVVEVEVEVEVEAEAFAFDRDGLAGLVSLTSWCAGGSSRSTVGTESSSSSEDDKTVFLRRGRPCAMLPTKLCGWWSHWSSTF